MPARARRSRLCPQRVGPHPDTLIACLPSCCSADNPAKQPPILFDDDLTWFATRNDRHLQPPAASTPPG
jgi:hypothetical protein